MALYRTYRPATFAEVVGQEHVTAPLSRALDTGRINHAYLFSGPRGCGKTSSARILARSLNCEQGPTSTPCGVCSSCVSLGPGGPGNLDVVELDAASHGGVDDTRDLRDRAFYAPAESRYRVFIIDEAHMVSSAGFNALLKIVEEPPEHLIFIFATTEPEKVLTTIKSRTHHYPFRLLAPPVMRGLLENICAKEGVIVAPEVYPLVIRAGGGSPRDSLSILDQLLAGAGDEGVTYERALSLLGVTDTALINDAVDALAAGDGSALFGVVESVVDAGHDPRRFAIDLLDRFRDLILIQAVPDAAERGLVEAPEDQIAGMHDAASKLGPATLTRFAEVAHAALGEMRGTTSPRLLLEVMCARLLLPSATADDAALLQRIETLERRPAGSGAATAAGGPAPIPSSAPSAPAADEPAPRFVRPSQRRAVEEARAAAPAEPQTPVPAPAPPVPEPAPVPQPEPVAPPEPVEPAPVAQPEPTVESVPPEPVAAQEPEPEPAPRPVVERPTPHPPIDSDPRAPEPPRREPEPEPVREQRRPEPEPEPERQERQRPAARAPQRPPMHDDEIPPAEPPMDPDYLPPPDDGYAPRKAAAAPEPTREPEPEQPAGLTVDAVSARWPEIRAAVRKQSSVLEAMLSAAFVHQVDGTQVTLGHPHPALVGRLADERGLRALTTAVVEVFGPGHTVGVVNAQPGSAPAKASAPAPEKPEPRRQTFTRPSRPRDPHAPEPSADYPPEPEEPSEPVPPVPDEELTDDERDEMVAQAHSGGPDDRLDPDQVALELLKSELGARPVE
ncbi:DNA polymerase III subunit gamma and tau [Gordonia phthalatica]|uniref:DNA polymerase III subunit gamma/tau n=1 Tax=Gordonia phthalatica TaxID=1136941 RepID=A0A0N9ND76_9ACTN|nr:DNA polymerase III subunit gamma and tau [Gordonia phthalatica]ALG83467.1 DNA polymerase III subunit gamma/tau [Gordonia phthalatica]